jgi:surface polysaccharide O-acyltransferase-like enzyme
MENRNLEIKPQFQNRNTKRNINLDYIRSLAIVNVICIHSMGILNEKESVDALSFFQSFFYSIYSTFIYTGVPLFVVLSGSLLLAKDEFVSSFYTKRFRRLLQPFFIWSLIAYILLSFKREDGCSVFDFMKSFFSCGVHGIYWYVYMIIGLYLFTPFLRKLLVSCSRIEMSVFVGLLFFINFTGYIIPDFSVSRRWVCSNSMFLFLFVYGYFCMSFLKYKPHFQFVSFLLFVVLSLLNFFKYLFRIEVIDVTPYLSICIFNLLVSLKLREDTLNARIVCFLSKISYGIYLSHFMIISFLCTRTSALHSVPLVCTPIVSLFVVLIVEMAVFKFVSISKLNHYFM